MPLRCAGGQTSRRVDDGVSVDAAVLVEVIDAAGLAEMLEPERFGTPSTYAAEPSQPLRDDRRARSRCGIRAAPFTSFVVRFAIRIAGEDAANNKKLAVIRKMEPRWID